MLVRVYRDLSDDNTVPFFVKEHSTCDFMTLLALNDTE